MLPGLAILPKEDILKTFTGLADDEAHNLISSFIASKERGSNKVMNLSLSLMSDYCSYISLLLHDDNRRKRNHQDTQLFPSQSFTYIGTKALSNTSDVSFLLNILTNDMYFIFNLVLLLFILLLIHQSL